MLRAASGLIVLGVLFCAALTACGDGSKAGSTTAATPQAGDGAKPQDSRAASAAANWKDAAKASAEKAVAFLRSVQSKDGTWAVAPGKPEVGVTALCLLAIMESPAAYREKDGEFISKGIEWLASMQKPDGSIHGGQLATYNTATSMLALAKTGNPKWKPVLDKALGFLRVVQSDEGENIDPSNRFYGGVGYEDGGTADLSNTQFAVEAAHEAGMPADDPFFKKVSVYLQRCQNRSESNDLKDPEIGIGNDGGGFYSPTLAEKDSKAGFVTTPDGRKVRRSYGSMSYCLLKSYIFCNLDRKDPRVRALGEWLSKNYRVDFNPGMEFGEKPESRYAGLFYYYVTMARALPATGADFVTDEKGAPRAWQKDLATQVVALQRPDGSWTNDRNGRWWENAPVLATPMALLALDSCLR